MYKVEMIHKYSSAAHWKTRGYLPHFQQPDGVQFITYRTADSLPRAAVISILEKIPASDASRRRLAFEELLDQCHGSCPLRSPDAATIIQDNLLHHDGLRYGLIAWCVMANHVHVLIRTCPDYPLPQVLHGWKSYTANRVNGLLGRSGAFWEREYFDRSMRDEEHILQCIEYIENNPVIAGVCQSPRDFAFSSARYRLGGSLFLR